jgi:hypothetical protein
MVHIVHSSIASNLILGKETTTRRIQIRLSYDNGIRGSLRWKLFYRTHRNRVPFRVREDPSPPTRIESFLPFPQYAAHSNVVYVISFFKVWFVATVEKQIENLPFPIDNLFIWFHRVLSALYHFQYHLASNALVSCCWTARREKIDPCQFVEQIRNWMLGSNRG